MSLTLTTTTTTEVVLKPRLKAKLLTKLKAYADLRTRFKALEAEMEASKGEIGLLREEADVESLSIEGFKVSQVTSVRKKFYLERLLAMGVTLEMWNDCHDPVPGKPYTKITIPGEKAYTDGE